MTSTTRGPRVRCECSESGCSAVVELSGIVFLLNVEMLVDVERGLGGIGSHCDCIVMRSRQDRTELYMIELKHAATPRAMQGVLSAFTDKMRGCLQLVEGLGIPSRLDVPTYRYCILVAPLQTHIIDRIGSILSRLRSHIQGLRRICDEAWIAACNDNIAIRIYRLITR